MSKAKRIDHARVLAPLMVAEVREVVTEFREAGSHDIPEALVIALAAGPSALFLSPVPAYKTLSALEKDALYELFARSRDSLNARRQAQGGERVTQYGGWWSGLSLEQHGEMMEAWRRWENAG